MANRNWGNPGVEQLLISVPRAAETLDLGTTCMWGLIRTNAVPSIRVGRRVLISRIALEAYVASLSDEGGRHRSERIARDGAYRPENTLTPAHSMERALETPNHSAPPSDVQGRSEQVATVATGRQRDGK